MMVLTKNRLNLEDFLQLLVEIDHEKILKCEGMVDILKHLLLKPDEQLKLKEIPLAKGGINRVMRFLEKVSLIEKFNLILELLHYISSVDSQKKVVEHNFLLKFIVNCLLKTLRRRKKH